MRKSNDIISSLALKRMCYILLRTWTEWWLNIGRHIKLTPSPQHLKQERGKSRESDKRKRGSSQLSKTKEKGDALFSVWDFRTCGWMNLQLSYRTVTNYKWFFRDKLRYLVEFGLVMYTRITEILWHKSIILEGKSVNMTKMWWHFLNINFTLGIIESTFPVLQCMYLT